MEQTLQKTISVSGLEADAAARLGESVTVDADNLLCVAIGEAEIAQFGGVGEAVKRCAPEVLADLVLAAVWRDAPTSRAVVARLDMLLSQRQAVPFAPLRTAVAAPPAS